MNGYLLAAAVFSAATCLTHIIVGGRFAARPLLNAKQLSPVAKYTTYYCWHMVTIVIAALAIGFALAATGQASRDIAIAATALSGIFIVWNVLLILGLRLKPLHFPQGMLFVPATVLGLVGLL